MCITMVVLVLALALGWVLWALVNETFVLAKGVCLMPSKTVLFNGVIWTASSPIAEGRCNIACTVVN